MTTAVVEIKRNGRWTRIHETDADGYPESFMELASAISAKDVADYVSRPLSYYDFVYRFDGRKVVYRCGNRGRWKPLRKLVLEAALERCKEERAMHLEAGRTAQADDMALAETFIREYDMLPWELKSRQDDGLYVIEPDGLPVLADPKYRRFVRKDTNFLKKVRQMKKEAGDEGIRAKAH